jgi:tetratricopeptide (TPR) repeat protein
MTTIRGRMQWNIAALLALAIAASAPAGAQQVPKDFIAAGDRDYDARHPQAARENFAHALQSEPENYEALWKASRVEVDLAESLPTGAAQDSLMTSAKTHAEAAVAANPHDAEGHFSLARALGRKALTVRVRDRIHFAKIVRAEALEALKYDSTHAGAMHVLGAWDAEIMRVNGLARAFAKAFLGAGVFGLASWDEAQRLLERAVQLDPNRIVHRLDLGVIYAERGNHEKAREQFEWIAAAPVREYNDPLYKQQAAERLKKLQ